MINLNQTHQPNKCGSCQVCCELVEVEDLNKPAHTRCNHQCESGCNIYPTRPEGCKLYACSYLEGTLNDESMRPDRCGVLTETVFMSFDADSPNRKDLTIIWLFAIRDNAITDEFIDELGNHLNDSTVAIDMAGREFVATKESSKYIERVIHALNDPNTLLGFGDGIVGTMDEIFGKDAK